MPVEVELLACAASASSPPVAERRHRDPVVLWEVLFPAAALHGMAHGRVASARWSEVGARPHRRGTTEKGREEGKLELVAARVSSRVGFLAGRAVKISAGGDRLGRQRGSGDGRGLASHAHTLFARCTIHRCTIHSDVDSASLPRSPASFISKMIYRLFPM